MVGLHLRLAGGEDKKPGTKKGQRATGNGQRERVAQYRKYVAETRGGKSDGPSTGH